MTPVYPLLLAGIMKLFGAYTFPSYVAAVGMNICFSALTCIPLFFAAKRIGGVGLAATAAWLWAVFPNAILLSFESLWETSLSALVGAHHSVGDDAGCRIRSSARLVPLWIAVGLRAHDECVAAVPSPAVAGMGGVSSGPTGKCMEVERGARGGRGDALLRAVDGPELSRVSQLRSAAFRDRLAALGG